MLMLSNNVDNVQYQNGSPMSSLDNTNRNLSGYNGRYDNSDTSLDHIEMNANGLYNSLNHNQHENPQRYSDNMNSQNSENIALQYANGLLPEYSGNIISQSKGSAPDDDDTCSFMHNDSSNDIDNDIGNDIGIEIGNDTSWRESLSHQKRFYQKYQLKHRNLYNQHQSKKDLL
jgi:hypothetical protein